MLDTRAADSAFLEGLQRWALARSGVPEVARVLRMLSAAAQQGQLGLPLHDSQALLTQAGPEQVDLVALQNSGWLSSQPDQHAAPMVLDAQRLYLWRHQRAEQRVATQMLQRAALAFASPSQAALPEALLPARHLPGEPGADQALAVQAAGRARLQVLSGGPGTGKTTTVLRLLLALLWAAQEAGRPLPRIALAAPTGKAAQRMVEALLQGKARLRSELGEAAAYTRFAPLLAAVPEQASTLHTLLEFLPSADRFRRNADDPLALDVLVVDEASMVDLELCDALLAALPEKALLILVGDPDQLVSVAVGTVLADVVSAADRGSPLTPLHNRLRFVWRASDALVELPKAIRAGDVAAVHALLEQPGAQLRWSSAPDSGALLQLQQLWLAEFGPGYFQLTQPGLDPAVALRRLTEVQVLCAVREGPFGVHACNSLIAAQVRRAAGVSADALWYPGRVVMLTHNQHALKLYNGDVGITLLDPQAADDQQLAVWFPGVPDAQGLRQPRRFLPRQLSDHEDAWAITVHKAQGSEYTQVLLMLPPDPQHRLLSRELLYTGVTRARERLHLWATAASVQAAVQRTVMRSGGLAERLG